MAISLGDVNFSLGADTPELAKALAKLQEFGKEVDKVSRRQSEGAERVAAAYRKQEAAITSALQKTLNLNAAIRRNDGGAALINQSNAAFAKYSTYVSRGQLNALQFQRANERLSASLGTVDRKLKDVVKNRTDQSLGILSRHLQDIATFSVLASGPLGGIAARITAFTNVATRAGLGTAAFLAGSAAAVIGITNLGNAIITNARKINVAKSQFEAITGSVSLSNALFKQAADIANTTGQSIDVLASQYARFIAAARGTAMSGKEVKDVFETVAAVTSKLQLPAEQAQGIFKALEQMMSKGTVQAEELRGQLGDRLPDAMGIAARAMGVTTQELNSMLKKGQVMADDLLPRMAEELKKTFHLDGAPIDNFQASINRLSNQTSLFLNELDRTLGVSTAAKNAIDGLASAMSFMKNNVVNLISALGGLAGALIALNIGTVVGLFGRLVSIMVALGAGLRTATFAMIGLNAAMIANPVGGLVMLFVKLAAALVAAVGGFLAVKSLLGDTEDGMNAANKTAEDFIKSMNGGDAAISSLGESLRDDLNTQIDQTREKLGKLKEELAQDQKPSKFTMMNLISPPSSAKAPEIEKLTKELDKAIKLREQLNKIIANPPKGKGAGPLGMTDKEIGHLEKANLMLDRAYLSLTTLGKGGTEALRRLNEEFARDDKVRQYAEHLEKAGIKGAEAIRRIEQFRSILEKFDTQSEVAKQYEDALKQLGEVGSRAMDRLGDSIGKMVEEGKFDLDSLRNVAKAALADLAKTIFQMGVINEIKNLIFPNQHSSTLGDIFSSFAGGFATGGTLQPGQWGIAGENGPEPIFAGNSPLHVTPNGGGSGRGDTTVVNLNVSTGVAQTVRAEMMQMLPQITESAKAGVMDARLRGGRFASAFR